jgi:hypothetical protein
MRTYYTCHKCQQLFYGKYVLVVDKYSREIVGRICHHCFFDYHERDARVSYALEKAFLTET